MILPAGVAVGINELVAEPIVEGEKQNDAINLLLIVVAVAGAVAIFNYLK